MGSWSEWLMGSCLMMTGGWLCFQSLWACLIGMAGLPLYLKYRKKEKEKRRKAEIWEEFRNVTAFLYSSTAAGGTLEKALRDAALDMRASGNRYPLLLSEFERIALKLDRNMSVEEVLNDFAVRSQDEDIIYFVRILAIAKKSGGSLPDVIQHTADTMNLRMEINSEIETILAGKKGELKVMLIVPPAILIYMNCCSPEYMAVLYHSVSGRLIMLMALLVYGGAAVIGRRILDIRI